MPSTMPSTRTSTRSSTRSCYFFSLILLLWLSAWIAMSWGAMQDDSLIHLRYADNLAFRSFVTYDGTNPDYGASSLLYVGLLSLLRRLTDSPELPRIVSSAVHLVLFAGLALALTSLLPRSAREARLAGMVLLALLATPSAVRWLDDGMETGLMVSLVTLIAWLVHGAVTHREAGSPRLRNGLLGAVAFLSVMLRTELLLLCGVGVVILLLKDRSRPSPAGQRLASGKPVVAVLLGAAGAVAVIVSTMHVLLPDTAVAKAHGIAHWFSPVHDTAVTLAGAFSFGAGMLAFWLLTLGLVARRAGLTLATVLANCFCPSVLAMSSLRGQEIQGVRYFSWTFAFSILWNILELAREPETETGAARPEQAPDRRGVVLLYVFAALLVVELPVESVAMHRVLTRRSETMRVFASQHLEVLRARRGVASDIGFIGYFTGARICDLAGLVNGRAAARLSSKERVSACARTKPEFLFANSGQYASMAAVMETSDWKVCGRYDFPNVRTSDPHYLLVRPELAEEVCHATGRQPETVATVFSVPPALVAQQAGE